MHVWRRGLHSGTGSRRRSLETGSHRRLVQRRQQSECASGEMRLEMAMEGKIRTPVGGGVATGLATRRHGTLGGRDSAWACVEWCLRAAAVAWPGPIYFFLNFPIAFPI
jgi:hypothetical protein